jgi:hypothetical protein
MTKPILFILLALNALAAKAQDFYVVDSLYCYFYDSLQNELPYLRQYNLAFTTDGEVLESRQEANNFGASDWANSTRSSYVYDGQNNLIELTEQHWDSPAQAWANFKRTLNTPNQNGDYTQVLNQEWINGDWFTVERLSSVFNAQGQIEILTREIFGNNGWQNSFRIIYANNASGKLVQTKFQLWDTNSNSFYDVNRQTYTYDSQQLGLETERLTEVFNTSNSLWETSSRNLKGYDSSGNLTEETTQLWNNVASAWQNQNRILQNFNAKDQVTLRTELLWNGSQWTNFYQTNNVYDAQFNLLRFEVSSWELTQWVLQSSCNFYPRLHHTVRANETPKPLFCSIPNPLAPGQPLFCPNLPAGQGFSLGIYDLQGRLVQFERLDNQQAVHINSSLPGGMYVATLYNGQGVFSTQKLLIIER